MKVSIVVETRPVSGIVMTRTPRVEITVDGDEAREEVKEVVEAARDVAEDLCEAMGLGAPSSATQRP